MANFSFIGKIVPVKESEKFKGYTETKYDSGWVNQKLRFNVIAGDNRHFVEINAGKWYDDKKNTTVYTMSKAEGGKKSKPIEISWEKRNDPEEINKVAGYKVFTIDTDNYEHRKALEESGDNVALEASKKKRKHFITGVDFCEYARKVVNSEKIQDMMFRICGNIVVNYGSKNDQYYTTYEVTKIYRVADNAEPLSEVNLDFYFMEDAVDSEDYNEKGKAIVSGYSMFYDSMTKKNWFYPVSLVIAGSTDEAGKKRLAGFQKMFDKFESDEVRKVSLVCQKIDGAQRVNIKYEDLPEDVRENIDFGLISLEDAIKDAGGQMYGDAIRELRIEKLGRGSSKGSETTIYTVDNLNDKPHLEEKFEEVDDSDFDLFAEDDDDDLI